MNKKNVPKILLIGKKKFKNKLKKPTTIKPFNPAMHGSILIIFLLKKNWLNNIPKPITIMLLATELKKIFNIDNYSKLYTKTTVY